MRRFWISVFLTLTMHTLFAQQTTEQINQKDLDAVNNTNFLIRPFNSGYEGVQGSPLWYENWSSGVIVMINNDSLNYELNYDAFEDQLIVQSQSTGEPMIPFQQTIKYFNLRDSIGAFHLWVNTHPDDIDEDRNRKGYFEVLYNGDLKLLVKHKKYFVEADFEGAYNSGKRYDEFKREGKKYYILKSDNSFLELKKGKKGVLRSLEDDGTLDQYLKKNKLDLRKEEDLIELIRVMDTNGS